MADIGLPSLPFELCFVRKQKSQCERHGRRFTSYSFAWRRVVSSRRSVAQGLSLSRQVPSSLLFGCPSTGFCISERPAARASISGPTRGRNACTLRNLLTVKAEAREEPSRDLSFIVRTGHPATRLLCRVESPPLRDGALRFSRTRSAVIFCARPNQFERKWRGHSKSVDPWARPMRSRSVSGSMFSASHTLSNENR